MFSDALLPLLRGIEPSVLTLLTRGGTAELAQLFPALGRTAIARIAGARRSGRAQGAPTLEFHAVPLALRREAPLLLVLENLQWADSASLEMLHFVARQIGGDRSLLVGTHNDPDHARERGAARTERSLRRLERRAATSGSRRSASTTSWSCSSSASAPNARGSRTSPSGFIAGPAAIRSSSTRRSRRSCRGGQLQSRLTAAWVGWDVEELHVPATIREAVLARLADLSPHARPTRRHRRRARHARDARRARGGERARSRNAHRGDRRAARRPTCSTEREDAGDIVYDFSHPLLQETLYSELGLARTRTLHGTVAESLERLYGAARDGARRRARVSLSRGDPRRLAAKAVEYLRAAGRDASAKYANREAARLSDGGARDRRAGDAAAPTPWSWSLELARVRQRLGDYDGAP